MLTVVFLTMDATAGGVLTGFDAGGLALGHGAICLGAVLGTVDAVLLPLQSACLAPIELTGLQSLVDALFLAGLPLVDALFRRGTRRTSTRGYSQVAG